VTPSLSLIYAVVKSGRQFDINIALAGVEIQDGI
jgi:hypothetical protein